jgi:plastocyanin domain-containing protein
MLSSEFTGKMMKVSAVLVMILGVGMLNNGLSLSGFNPISLGLTDSKAIRATVASDVQHVTTTVLSGSYENIVLQKGLPVKWNIQAALDNLNGCNNPIVIPKYNIEIRLQPGDNIIEFTPDETGVISYSCWMGMIRSSIKVVEKI